jgi:hypothetical protein
MSQVKPPKLPGPEAIEEDEMQYGSVGLTNEELDEKFAAFNS